VVFVKEVNKSSQKPYSCLKQNNDNFIFSLSNVVRIVMVSLALVTMIVSVSGSLVTSSFAQDEEKFTAKMTGKEVPAKDVKASGDAEFTLNVDGKTMSYKVDVMNIDKVTMAHIHQGKVGENGAPVV
jgi:hypothetical protein